jgi:integrase
LRDSGELAPRTWTNYHQTCSRIIDVLGKHRAVADLQPDDFRKLRTALAKGRGVVSVHGDVTRSRVFFKFCDTEGLIDRPVKYGTGFDLPNPKAIRLAREARGIRMFEPHEIRQLLAAADPAMKAMILLGVNAAFGQSDLARLPKSAIDLERGWIAFGRPKTGIARKCPLWRETIDAVKAAIAARPEPKAPGDRDLVFLTATGLPVVRDRPTTGKDNGQTTHLDTVGPAFRALMKVCGLNGNRAFYAIRHTFQTVAEECGDFPAIGHIMGHTDSSMAGRYREKFAPDRLQKVVDHVRAWLWPTKRVAKRKGSK